MKEKQTILAIDDMRENLLVLKGLLVPKYSLLAATSGEAALKVIEKNRPDLILSDIMMPGMDGYELCRHLKAHTETADIPVIFVSAMSEVSDEKKGFEVGAVDYVTKPIKAEVLRMRVKTHLALADQQRACHEMVKERTQELEQTQRAAIQMLGIAGHYNDNDTGVHIWRMAAYSGALARAIGWSVEDSSDLELAAAMHDTGKIGIPDSILKAPRKLTSEEWAFMQTHTQIGARILSESDTPIFQLAAQVAHYHHEKWDGSGYPDGLKGEDIPECARIVAIADVFDALTMDRPYKRSWTAEDAIKMIGENSGTHFDAGMVQTFLSILPEIYQLKRQWDGDDSQQEAYEK